MSLTPLGFRCPPNQPVTNVARYEEISLGMFPSEHFHQIQEEVAVLLTVSLFIIVVIASWLQKKCGGCGTVV